MRLWFYWIFGIVKGEHSKPHQPEAWLVLTNRNRSNRRYRCSAAGVPRSTSIRVSCDSPCPDCGGRSNSFTRNDGWDVGRGWVWRSRSDSWSVSFLLLPHYKLTPRCRKCCGYSTIDYIRRCDHRLVFYPSGSWRDHGGGAYSFPVNRRIRNSRGRDLVVDQLNQRASSGCRILKRCNAWVLRTSCHLSLHSCHPVIHTLPFVALHLYHYGSFPRGIYNERGSLPSGASVRKAVVHRGVFLQPWGGSLP